MDARGRKVALLLSSSLSSSVMAALLVGGGAPAAWAACGNNIHAGFDNPAAQTTPCVAVTNTSFTGNITNEGTISPGGITFSNGTITGSIISTGTIAGGISLDSKSAISSTGTAIAISGGAFSGGISNNGTIAAGSGRGILVGGDAMGAGLSVTMSTFSGGITNAGSISSGSLGIQVGGEAVAFGSHASVTVSNFSGGISNSGSITAAQPGGADGIWVGGLAAGSLSSVTVSTFSGGITNGGTISITGSGGILVGGFAIQGTVTVSSFTGGISNSGTISDSGLAGILVGGVGALVPGSLTVSSFAGGIRNSGTISVANALAGILVGGVGAPGSVTVSTFAGGISNGGTISAANALAGIMVGGVSPGGGSVTVSSFAGGISNGGSIAVAGGGFFSPAGIQIGGTAFVSSSVTVSSFSGGVGNNGTISVAGGGKAFSAAGIQVGGNAFSSGAFVTVSSFAGGISNKGTISVGGAGAILPSGIQVGGNALASGASVMVSSFAGGISNNGTISVAGGTGSPVSPFVATGIQVGGNAFASGSSVTVSSFAGGISNNGTISVAGGGAFVASGIQVGGNALFSTGASVTVSTFSGGISNSGTISVTSSNGFATAGIIVGGLGGSGTAVAISSFGGGISNSGTITVITDLSFGPAAGIVLAAGAISNFAGGISNSGTITVQDSNGVATGTGIGLASGTLSTFAGGITNSGTISARSGIAVVGVSTFLGNIANSGTITAAHAGIFICDCSTLAGGSIVNTGTITAPIGISVANFSAISIFDSGTITSTVGPGGKAIDLRHATGGNTVTLGPGYNITGRVLGAGSDTLQLGGMGGGAFDLSKVGPTQQYQGFTTFNVVSGTWTVSNTFGQTQAWNVNGGILAGTGTLPTVNVNNGGTLEPGTIGAPGTSMTVTGNLTFQSGASYLVNLSPTAASRVNVGGTATLAGSVFGFLAPGSYSGSKTYDILDPPTLSGKFIGFTSLNAPAFVGTLTYTPTDVLLNLTATLGAGGGLNANQQSVANTINSFFNIGGTVPANFFPLFTLSGANLANALTPLTGEVATDAGKGASQLMTEFLELMLDPNLDGRGGAGGGASMFVPEREANLPPDIALAYARVLKKAPPLKAPPPPQTQSWTSGWTSWAAGFGGYNQSNGDPLVVGSHDVIARDFGYVAGADNRITPDTKVGFALGGGGTNWGLAQGLGSGRSDAFLAGVHLTTHLGPAYVAGALGFANHWFSTTRVSLGDQLGASFNGESFGARLEAGYRQLVPTTTSVLGVTPYAAVQAQLFHTPSYNETDLTGGGFARSFADKSATDTRSELGARFDDLTALGGMPLLLHGRLAWAHDWVSTPGLSAGFVALPGPSFPISGAATAPDSLLTTAAAELAITPAWSVSGKFDGEFARGSQTYAGTGTVRYRW